MYTSFISLSYTLSKRRPTDNRQSIMYKAFGFTKQYSLNLVNDYKAFRSDGLLTSLSSVSREEMAKLLVADLVLV